MKTHEPVSYYGKRLAARQGRNTFLGRLLPRWAPGALAEGGLPTEVAVDVCFHQHRYHPSSVFSTLVEKRTFVSYLLSLSAHCLVISFSFLTLQLIVAAWVHYPHYQGEASPQEEIVPRPVGPQWHVVIGSRPGAPCVSVSSLSQNLKMVKIGCVLVKRTKIILKCLANTTNPSAYLLYLFSRPCILYVNRVIIKYIF